MNQVNLIGRLTRDAEIRYSQGENSTAVARTTLAIDNPFSDNADFIGIVAFGKTAEFIEKYTKQGQRIGITGRIQTGSYDHKDGYKVYTTDVVVSNVYFADSKQEDEKPEPKKGYQKKTYGKK